VGQDTAIMQKFVRNLLRDVQAFEYMLNNDWFETGIKRIGAEQEMCLVNRFNKPAYKSMQILKDFHPDWLTTELGQFNLEANLTPQDFKGSALSNMEKELLGYVGELRKESLKHDTDILLTGIMPTLRKFDLAMDKLTPKERYFALMRALKELRGSDYELRLEGIDELIIRHDSPLLEACNTSFQVHLQVDPKSFVQMYNIALAVAGPVMAIAANSPLLFGKRLWHETRIALFQQSIDTRTSHDHLRDRSPRVTFGEDWLHNSILEIYREDIVRFRVLLGNDIEEDAFEKIAKKEAPKLRSLLVHNSTVYRWMRPCYGISENGKPHLRIENRVFPSGPSVIDEMANAAFWLGLMEGCADQYPDITKQMIFEDARDNFIKGARTGIDSKFTWLKDMKISAKDLATQELIPLARLGLQKNGIDAADIDKYLGVIEDRVNSHTTGARWILRTYTKFMKETNKDESVTALTSFMLQNQHTNTPVHKWEIPNLEDLKDYQPANLTVEEIMTTDLFTVRKEDILELVADMMDWRQIRYMPVEDKRGQVVGLITSRLLLRHFTRKNSAGSILTTENLTVEDIMLKNPITISTTANILDALQIMDEKKIGCLPVIKDGELVGIITETDFLKMSKRLLKKGK
jgi:CBS domain-containing protein